MGIMPWVCCDQLVSTHWPLWLSKDRLRESGLWQLLKLQWSLVLIGSQCGDSGLLSLAAAGFSVDCSGVAIICPTQGYNLTVVSCVLSVTVVSCVSLFSVQHHCKGNTIVGDFLALTFYYM